MEEESLQKYLHQILRLKRSASNGGAPHKPILLFLYFCETYGQKRKGKKHSK